MNLTDQIRYSGVPVTVHQFALLDMVQPTGNPIDLAKTAFALRLAKADGPETYQLVLAHAMQRRADWRRTITLWQRSWGTKVSRRPQRGRHHDSWSIREKYVRCI